MDAITQDLLKDHESSHTTGRMSGRQPVELLLRVDRRRSWSIEEKREIVAESLGPKGMVAEVARKHGITSGQLYTWRRHAFTVREQLMRGSGPEPHVHPENDEWFYVMDYGLEVQVGGNASHATSGQSVFIPRGIADLGRAKRHPGGVSLLKHPIREFSAQARTLGRVDARQLFAASMWRDL